MKRAAPLAAAVLLSVMTAVGGAHLAQAAGNGTYYSCHFSHGNAFKVYTAQQAQQVEKAGGTCVLQKGTI
jgi:hypothetical protein